MHSNWVDWRTKYWIKARPNFERICCYVRAGVVLLEPVDETNSPARIDRRPIELALRLRVGAAANLRHYRHTGFADHDFSHPVGNLVRRFCLDGLGERRQPGRDFGRLIVDDVVDARCATGDRRDCCARGVEDVNEGPDSPASADDGKASLPDHFVDVASFADCGTRPVEPSVSQGERFEERSAADLLLEVANCCETLGEAFGRLRIERIFLSFDWPSLLRVRPAAVALRDESAGADGPRGRKECVGDL